MLNKLRRAIGDFDSDDILEKLGVESRRSSIDKVMPAVAVFAAGVAVGVGIGLILAPKSGSELRGDLQSQFRRAKGRMMREAEELGADGEHPAPSPASVRPA